MKTYQPSLKRSIKLSSKGIYCFLVATICILLFSGCTNYQYVSIGSQLDKDEKNQFYVNNDTVSIQYSFVRKNFQVSVSIYNKLQKPLYIDWGRTLVIINGNQINDSFYHEEQAGYIAPQSFVTILSNTLQDQFLCSTKLDSLANLGAVKDKNREWVRYSFSEETSPVYFRSIIALSTDENLTSPVFIDQPFWFSEVLQNSVSPSETVDIPSNQFYFRKQTGFGKFMGWTAGIAALLLLGTLSTGE
jgi:hypothetical protein